MLINQALHTLDLMNMLGGGVKAVTAHCSNDHLRGIIEVEDTVSVFAEFRAAFAEFSLRQPQMPSPPP